MTGTIKTTKAGFGFIKRDDGASDVFFYHAALAGLEFGEHLVGQRVEFEPVESDRGPRASNVRAI